MRRTMMPTLMLAVLILSTSIGCSKIESQIEDLDERVTAVEEIESQIKDLDGRVTEVEEEIRVAGEKRCGGLHKYTVVNTYVLKGPAKATRTAHPSARSGAFDRLASAWTAENGVRGAAGGRSSPRDAQIRALGLHLDWTGRRPVIHFYADLGPDRREAYELGLLHGGWPRARGSTT